MKTFAFVPTNSLKKAYEGVVAKYKRQDWMVDLFKIWFLATIFLTSFLIYLIYVSLSSTQGYFLRKENQRLNTISFRYEMLKTDLLEEKQKNRETIITTPLRTQKYSIVYITGTPSPIIPAQ